MQLWSKWHTKDMRRKTLFDRGIGQRRRWWWGRRWRRWELTSNRFGSEWRNSNGLREFMKSKEKKDNIRSDCRPFSCASICPSDGANFGGIWEGNTQIPSGLINRWAAAGGRRSKGGMPWSGRRVDEAARWCVGKWKWFVEAAEKFRREGNKFSPTLDHATQASPQPRQARSHFGPGIKRPTNQMGGNK